MIFLKHVFHIHEWKFVETCWGELPKDNTPEKQYIRAYLERCECGARRIVPLAIHLHPTEIEE